MFNPMCKIHLNGKNIGKETKKPVDNLSVSGDFLSDMGISPSGESNINLSKIWDVVKNNDVLVDTISRVIVCLQNGRDYIVKKYNGISKEKEQSFFDFVIKRMDNFTINFLLMKVIFQIS